LLVAIIHLLVAIIPLAYCYYSFAYRYHLFAYCYYSFGLLPSYSGALTQFDISNNDIGRRWTNTLGDNDRNDSRHYETDTSGAELACHPLKANIVCVLYYRCYRPCQGHQEYEGHIAAYVW
jgi:hypothetical protein